MELSHDLIADFTKALKPVAEKKNSPIMYGTVVVSDGKTYVKIDGSDQLTPFTSATAVSQDERVLVTIQDHAAIVTGNISSPAAKDSSVAGVIAGQAAANDFVVANKYVESITSKFADVQTVLAGAVEAGTVDTKHLEAIEAEIEKLQADYGKFENIDVDKLRALSATIDKLYADFGQFDHIEADELDAIKADIQVLRSYTGTFTHLSAHDFEAIKATVQDLKVKNAEIAWANINFANIDKARFAEFYAASGIIEDYVSENGTVTGKLVAVSINADNIDTGTLKAERLMLQGDDGLFYKLNVDAMGQTTAEALPADEQEKLKEGIHGKSIIAESITADKISVSDLVAFNATIGGFVIGQNRYVDNNGVEHENTESPVNSIHSYAKPTVDADTRGIYLDSDGQMNVGDGSNYIKYYYDETAGQYKLKIAANQMEFKTSNLKVGARNLIRNSVNLIYEDYSFRGITFTADIIDGVMVLTGNGSADIIDGVLVVTGNATASIENNILIVK